MTFIASVKPNGAPLEEQMASIASRIAEAFPHQVRISTLTKLSTILLDFSKPVTLHEIRGALADYRDQVTVVEDRKTVSLPGED